MFPQPIQTNRHKCEKLSTNNSSFVSYGWFAFIFSSLLSSNVVTLISWLEFSYGAFESESVFSVASHELMLKIKLNKKTKQNKKKRWNEQCWITLTHESEVKMHVYVRVTERDKERGEKANGTKLGSVCMWVWSIHFRNDFSYALTLFYISFALFHSQCLSLSRSVVRKTLTMY